MVNVKKESGWYLTPPKRIEKGIQQTTPTFKLRMRSGVTSSFIINKFTVPINPQTPHQTSKKVSVVKLRPRIESRCYGLTDYNTINYKNIHGKRTRLDIRYSSTPRSERYISLQPKQKTDESRMQPSNNFLSPTADKIPSDEIIGPPPLLISQRFRYYDHVLPLSESDKLQMPSLPIL